MISNVVDYGTNSNLYDVNNAYRYNIANIVEGKVRELKVEEKEIVELGCLFDPDSNYKKY
jgi:hypothetical protein